MSDELERKRQEKVANFKLNFKDLDGEDAEPDGSSYAGAEEGVQGENVPGENGSSEVFSTEDDQSGEQPAASGGEINSFSSASESESKAVDKKSLKKAKKIDRKRRKKKAKKNRIVFRISWIVMVVLASIMIGEYIMVGVNDILGVGRDDNSSVTITIPENADIDQITDILYEKGVINVKWSFQLYARMTKATSGFTKGTFEVNKGKDYQALINYMRSDMNRTDVVTVRFTEGMSIRQYAKLLEDNEVCSKDKFLEACNSDKFDDYEFIEKIPAAKTAQKKREYKLEGYLFPDTYDFYVDENVDSVIEKFLANYRRKVYARKKSVLGYDKKMTVAERAETINMTMDQVLTLASLIQAEAANKDDMYEISAILHNRLATMANGGMNANGEGHLSYLQLDSTKYYPYLSLDDIPLEKKKTFKSKYNTYDIEGLPPGPICNPGLEAIEAALEVGDTQNYYFCHKSATDTEPAQAYYAETLEQHEKNKMEAGLS